MSCRVYVGNVPSKATERDVEHFFRGFGRIRDVVMKNGFGFVEFEDSRDADDAVYEMNGRELCGERVVVEISHRDRGPGGGGGGRFQGGGRGGFRGGGGGGGGFRGGSNTRYGPPMQTRYRMMVYNLSTRCSWQDLKDLMRNAGEVTYADAHKKTRNEAIVCFTSHEDLKRAIHKYQGKDINGRRIKLVDESEGRSGGGRSRSRSRSPASRSRSRSPRSRTRSPPSRSRSVSKGAAENGRKGSKSRSPSRSRSRSRSPSKSPSASPEK